MILYFGAVFTKVFVVHQGSRIYPNEYAVWIQEIEVESDKSIQQQPEVKTVIEVPETKPWKYNQVIFFSVFQTGM